MNAQTERLSLAGPAGRVQALRDQPEGTPHGVAVIAHPHPLFGGTMDNKVVQTLARAFVQCGWTAVRFNFRGVGSSEGFHEKAAARRWTCRPWCGKSPRRAPSRWRLLLRRVRHAQALQALWTERDVRALVLVGTAASRFQVPALPPESHDRTLVIHGEKDETVPLAAALDWARPQSLPVTVVPGVEHFFHGQLPLLKNLVLRHLRSLA
jgi:alpha/beta superfamily hydrolase